MTSWWALGKSQLAAIGVLTDHEYEEKKDQVKEGIEKAGAVFGVICILSASEALRNFSQKSSEILLSAPCAFFSYNLYQLCQNARTMADDQRTYAVLKGLPNGWDMKSARGQLLSKTICCEWMVDLAVRELVKRSQQPATQAKPAAGPPLPPRV